jgi:hypothetical protein
VRPRTLLILFLVVAALSAFVWFYERDLPGSDERAKQGKKLLDLKKDDVTALTLERPGRDVRLERAAAPKPPRPAATKAVDETVAAESAPADWRMTRPIRAAADGLAVAGLVESLVGLDKERTLEHPDRRALGLDSPQATVRLETSRGAKVLAFGAKVPTSGEVMVAVEGDPRAYAVADSVLTTLERDPGEWRDKQIFRGDRERIDRISLAGPAGGIVLARRGDAFWIESPPAARDRADRDLVDSLLGDLTALRADRFVDDAAKTPARTLNGMGLAPPRGAVEVVQKGDPRPFRLELGGAAPTPSPAPAPTEPPGAPPPPPPAPAVYARSGDEVFETAQSGLAAAVGRSAADWRSKALSGLQVYQVDGARVTDAAGTLDLTRSGTDWKRGSTTIPYTPVSDLLFAVTGAKAARLVSAAEARQLGAALDRPLLTIVMKGQGSAGAETVTLYPPVAAGVPALTSGRDAVLLLASDQLANIQRQVAAVRGASPVAPTKTAITP